MSAPNVHRILGRDLVQPVGAFSYVLLLKEPGQQGLAHRLIGGLTGVGLLASKPDRLEQLVGTLQELLLAGQGDGTGVLDRLPPADDDVFGDELGLGGVVLGCIGDMPISSENRVFACSEDIGPSMCAIRTGSVNIATKATRSRGAIGTQSESVGVQRGDVHNYRKAST